jgi:CRISPR system Cascade subunit CasA
MTTSYNLLDEPWLPVVSGPRSASVGIREFFTNAHDFDDLAVPVPPAASGLWRILYAIGARVTGLDQSDDWGDRQADWLDRGEFDSDRVDAYLSQHRERFDLFHPERPWLQDPRLRTQCTKTSSVNKLVFDRPAGNTHVWFGHYTDGDPVPIPSSEAAWYLVAQLYYGASGQCTSREVDGQKFTNSNAGPLRGAMSYHPVGKNLFESLILGMPPMLQANEVEDRCPWERGSLPLPLGVPYEATWPAGLLTARFQHAVLLVPASDGRTVTDAYVTWAWRRPPDRARDPYVVRKLSKQGNWYQLQADGARALWRDVDALLADDTDGRHRPEIMASAADLDPDARIRAFGFDQDGQAKDRQWFTAVTPPILRWLGTRDVEVSRGVSALQEAADLVGHRLGFVMKAVWQEMVNAKDNTGPWVRPAEAYYWARAEDLFWKHVRDRDFEDPKRAFKALGHRSIDYAADAETRRPRVAGAVASAHRRLASIGKEGVGA